MNTDTYRATLASIARLEAAQVRPPRLTQPGLDKWHRYRRKLGWTDLVELLHADLASAFPEPFDLDRWPERPALDEDAAQALLEAAAATTNRDSADFLRDCARLLGLPAGGALTDAPKLQPHHQVLELPGSGGRIAAYLCANDSALSFDRQFTFVAATPAERVAIGLAAVERRASAPRIVTPDDLAPKYDRVVGLAASPAAQALAARFPEARLI